jgi:hypothetical protein
MAFLLGEARSYRVIHIQIFRLESI